MTSLAFTIPGPIVPWMRAGGNGRGRYTPKRQREYQERVQWAAVVEGGKDRHGAGFAALAWPLEARYGVAIEVHRDLRRFDLDNCAKTVLDACEGILWANDSAVWQLELSRHLEREEPRTVVRAWVLE